MLLLTFNLIIMQMKPHLRSACVIIGDPILHGRLLEVVCVDVYPEGGHGGAHCARGCRL